MNMDGIEKCLLGLTTVQEIFRVAPPEIEEAHKESYKEIIVQNEEDAGEIPVQDSRLSLSSIKPKKILVAEDNKMTLDLLTYVLEYENYHIITAANGIEAMKLAFLERPDLIVTDLLMPKMGGLTLIKRLKSQLSTRFIPIIVLTGKDDVKTEVELFEAGANDFIIKPVDQKKLLARVRRLLRETPTEEKGGEI
jgi:PleD family two-component response regulator